jgi:hypothetical protein
MHRSRTVASAPAPGIGQIPFTRKEDTRGRAIHEPMALRRLMPATASMLIHLGIVGAVLVVPGWAPMRLPALMAELVEPDAPAPPSLAWPLTPPRPIATPMPLEPPAPPRPEPEPARPTAPEPPPATTRPEPEPPRAAATESARMPTPSPEAGSPVAVTGPSISAAPGSWRRDVRRAGAGFSEFRRCSAVLRGADTGRHRPAARRRHPTRDSAWWLPVPPRVSVKRAASRNPGHGDPSRAGCRERARRRGHRQAVRRTSRSRPGCHRRGPSLAVRAGAPRRGAGGDVGAAPLRVQVPMRRS